MCTVGHLGSAPLWIFVLGQLAGPQGDLVTTLYKFELWLLAGGASYGLGMVVNAVRPACAAALLNWLVKPLLLLFSLLFITIGVYINLYVFHIHSAAVPLAAATLPLFGYLTGCFITSVARQQDQYVKVIATEATTMNCLSVLVMIRFSCPQPAADLTAAMPFWVLILTPVPFLTTSLIHRVRAAFHKRCAKRKERKYRHFSIASSLLNVTNVTNLSASITPKMNSPGANEDNDITDNSALIDMIDEKITVL